ncbi:MAG: response regulator [Deltaproteobacteria bacterium]|jgi:two-component system chemotaxis response regulator CheY|nr:response regulator [Deltaproteobacteria bacterium]
MIKKILLVDDSPISRRMMKSCIPKDRGYELFEACDGLAGFEAYKEIRPDVTFMDLTMPVMDGSEATGKIREFNPEAVVIVCTADIQIKSITNALNQGALMVMKKPPSKETVEDALLKADEHIG